MPRDALLLHRLPAEFLPSARYRCRYVERAFADPPRVAALLERAAAEPFPAGVSYAVRAALGLAVEARGLLLFATPGTFSEHRTILSLARARGAETREIFLPRGAADADRFLEEMAAATGTGRDEAEARFRRLSPARARLAELAREGLLAGAALDRAALDLAEGAEPRLTPRRSRALRRVAVAGGPPHPALHAALAERGAVAVLTTESFHEGCLAEAGSLAEAWAAFPHPGAGIAARARRFGAMARAHGAELLIHLLVPLSHEGLECEIFRESAGLPTLPIELSAPDTVDRRTVLRLEAFLETA